MEEYIIHVTKTGFLAWDRSWGVGFYVIETGYSGKEVTFCMLRGKGYWFAPRAGCSVKNPLDAPDSLRGKRTAFKRAVESLFFEGMSEDDKKRVLNRFRGALWITMGRPGYKREHSENRVQLEEGV